MAAEYPSTGSTLGSNISTGLSTQIVVKVGTDTVGAIQQLQINQTRPIQRTGELGLDGTLELVPNNRTDVTISVTRIVFDRLRLPEAFARGFISIKSQRIPFNIEIIDRTAGSDENAITHSFKSCWFNNYQTPYQADNYIISESGNITVEDYSVWLGSGRNAAQGGAREMSPQIEEYERSADRGERRGTMDAPGLINAAFSS